MYLLLRLKVVFRAFLGAFFWGLGGGLLGSKGVHRVEVLRFRVYGSGFQLWDLRFRV